MNSVRFPSTGEFDNRSPHRGDGLIAWESCAPLGPFITPLGIEVAEERDARAKAGGVETSSASPAPPEAAADDGFASVLLGVAHVSSLLVPEAVPAAGP